MSTHHLARRARLATRVLAGAAALAAAAAFLSGCSSSPDSDSGSGSKPTTSSDGTPDLSGKTINIAIGAAPAITDTRVALMAKILTGWGADAKVVNQVGDPAAIRVILSGDAQVGSVAAPTSINSGLVVFGPSQPRLDYHFIGAPSLTSMKDLPGKIYGTSNTHGVEALSFATLLKAYKINPDKVTVTVAGGASVRVSAMIAGHIQATFVHADNVKTLTDQGFNDLATMSKVAPDLADSFLATTPQWVKDNPELAQAVDLAWIKAAQIFNDDEDQWVQAAVAYAGGSEDDAKALWQAFKDTDTFPAANDAFSKSSAQSQEEQAAQVGAINSSPDISKWFTASAWDAAVKASGIK